jgi:hypothetical protein
MPEDALRAATSAVSARKKVSVKLPNGEELGLEQLDSAAAGNVAGALGDLSLDRLGRIVEGLVQVMAPVALAALPGKTTVEIGLEVSVEGGKITALLVDAGAKTNLKVKMEWERSPSTADRKIPAGSGGAIAP